MLLTDAELAVTCRCCRCRCCCCCQHEHQHLIPGCLFGQQLLCWAAAGQISSHCCYCLLLPAATAATTAADTCSPLWLWLWLWLLLLLLLAQAATVTLPGSVLLPHPECNSSQSHWCIAA
jgi:hypothetical protein